MIRLGYILWIMYIAFVFGSYPYLRRSYFPQNPTKMEKFVSGILALVWFVSVPTTLIMKTTDNDDDVSIQGSVESFVGSEQ